MEAPTVKGVEVTTSKKVSGKFTSSIGHNVEVLFQDGTFYIRFWADGEKYSGSQVGTLPLTETDSKILYSYLGTVLENAKS